MEIHAMKVSNNKRKKFKDIESYAVYYGYDGEDKLKDFDLVIVEPQGQSKETIEKLKDGGSIVIAYISVMEIHKTNPNFNFLREEDFLRIDGDLVVNEEYGTILTNICSSRWSSLLIHNIANLVFNQGYDGVFLDTIGDIEYEKIPMGLKNILIGGVVNFIHSIRKCCGDCIIIQNNGLNYLYRYTKELIDGICWENPEFKDLDNYQHNEAILRNLKYLQKEIGIKVFILFEKKENENFYEKSTGTIRFAIEKIFQVLKAIIYIAPNKYLSLDD